MLDVPSSVGLRFERVLPDGERAQIEHALSSTGAALTSWTPVPEAKRTYALACGDAARVGAAVPGAKVDAPPLAVLRVEPASAAALPALAHALAGPGRPVAAIETIAIPAAIIVAWDSALCALTLLLDLIDIETGGRRRVRPLFPLHDRALAQLGGALLGLGDLSPSRFIESQLELARARRA